jgi:hypothetical protein
MLIYIFIRIGDMGVLFLNNMIIQLMYNAKEISINKKYAYVNFTHEVECNNT